MGARSIIASVAIVGVVAFVLLALRRLLQLFSRVSADDGSSAASLDPEGVRLREERARMLRHLRELTFDHETGKLGDHDYQVLRERYERRALAALDAVEAWEALRADREVSP